MLILLNKNYSGFFTILRHLKYKKLRDLHALRGNFSPFFITEKLTYE